MGPPLSSPGTYRIARAAPHRHVTDAIVRRLEDEVSEATGWRIDESASPLVQKLARFCARSSLRDRFFRESDVGTFMVMLNPATIPHNAAKWLEPGNQRVAWLFDAWPSTDNDLLEAVERYTLDKVFVTARQSAQRLNEKTEHDRFAWCPEPLVDLGFRSKPWSERTIDVLQFGRRYDSYHDSLVRDTGAVYLYQGEKGTVVFPSTEQFVEGLASSKISVCFPSDITHPERAGDVSTMTQRYLQSMASGCLLLGTSPPEMIELMGYDPVVQADMDDPAGQIRSICADPGAYAPLIARNMQEVARHSVARRMESILGELT